MGDASAVARLPNPLLAALPLAVIAVLVAGFIALDPLGDLRAVPPVEEVTVERTVLTEDRITLAVRNGGPDPVRIAQVLVNEAYNAFTISDPELGRLESATLDIPYPWDEGLPVHIGLVTSTGAVLEHDIEVASLTPEATWSTFLVYALLGLYIGVIPVAIGLLWFPALRRASARWLAFFLAFTVGLLVFLLLDTVAEGLELAGQAGAALDGLSLFGAGLLAAVLCLVVLDRSLEGRRGRGAARGASGLALAYLVAGGIGLHNLGEGLAVGAALAAGEIALGTFLVVGFAVHNTTEGLAIVAPLGKERQRPSLLHFVGLGVVAGAPTIAGALAGGFAFSAAWSALAFGVAAGAIAVVVWQIARSIRTDAGLTSVIGAVGLLVGFLFMYATGLLAA
ncbi:MAG: ZIP family metal transporter [Actinomycetota bacterium]